MHNRALDITILLVQTVVTGRVTWVHRPGLVGARVTVAVFVAGVALMLVLKYA